MLRREDRGENVDVHEALAGWDLLIAHLSGLPGFRSDALAAMMQPAFAACEMIAFRR
ncbi:MULTISPECIES: hypothetical protein [unclassified Sphingopyxis]|uniref:hypothetical protein n=1 Tax=unclassified Sphingopyxis TaxID=2614943 RepID=UPI001F32F515|nr:MULTISPECIES: hypothetical protein [unclassified Sphingopyxis]